MRSKYFQNGLTQFLPGGLFTKQNRTDLNHNEISFARINMQAGVYPAESSVYPHAVRVEF